MLDLTIEPSGGQTLETDPFNPTDMRGRMLTWYATVREGEQRGFSGTLDEKGLSV